MADRFLLFCSVVPHIDITVSSVILRCVMQMHLNFPNIEVFFYRVDDVSRQSLYSCGPAFTRLLSPTQYLCKIISCTERQNAERYASIIQSNALINCILGKIHEGTISSCSRHYYGFCTGLLLLRPCTSESIVRRDIILGRINQ